MTTVYSLELLHIAMVDLTILCYRSLDIGIIIQMCDICQRDETDHKKSYVICKSAYALRRCLDFLMTAR